MTEIRAEIVIERPIEEVFAFVHDPSNDPLWQTSVADVDYTGDGPLEVGSEVTETRRFLGRRLPMTWQVVELDPPSHSAIKATSSAVPFQGTYDLESTDTGTRLVAVATTDASGFFKLAEPVFARMARRELAANLGHLKDLLEAGA